MKNMHYSFTGFFVFICCICSYAQVNTAILNSAGNVSSTVNSGSFFRIDVSISYDTDTYTDYKLIVQLPDGVSWNKTVSTDPTIILIDESEIEQTGQEFTIPFTLVTDGKKSVNFFLNSLQNDTPQSCSTPIVSPISFELIAKRKSDELVATIGQSTSDLTTPKVNDINGTVDLWMAQNQEVNSDGTNAGNYPYYIDVQISGQNLSVKPTVTLTYPHSKLSYVNAVLFSNKSNATVPFHKEILDGGPVTHNSGLIAIDVNDSRVFGTANDSRDIIRFYFNVVNNSASIVPGEIELKAEGAQFVNCEGNVVHIETNPELFTTTFPVVSTGSVLYPSIAHENRPFSFCVQNCDFDINDPTTSFYFEANGMYTNFGATPSNIKIINPTEVALISALRFNLDQYDTPPVVTYLTLGATEEITATISGNEATFSGNPHTIFIKNYVTPNTANVAKDFEIKYMTLLSDLSSIVLNQKIFTVSYQSIENVKKYESSSVQILGECVPNLRFEDRYENPNASANQRFSSTVVTYFPNTYHNVRIKITPRQIKYQATYEIADLTYVLNENMSFDPQFGGVLFSETGEPGSYSELTQNMDATYYENIRVTKESDGRTLKISALLDNTIDCEVAKDLYLIIPIYVKREAVAINSNYQAQLILAGNSFSSLSRGAWNVVRSSFDKVSASLEVLCPSDRQVFSQYTKGQDVLVRYVVSNENQNSISKLKLTIPSIENGIFASGSNWLNIFSKNAPNVNLNNSFVITPETSDVTLETSNYILSGNNQLFVEVRYLLNSDVSLGTIENTISFNLDKYFSIGGVEREAVSSENLGRIEIVSQSLCIPKPPCENCVTSLSPLPGHEYLLGAWVKESFNTGLNAKAPAPVTYLNAGIKVTFNDGLIDELPLFIPDPSNPVIDGWQRIEASFVVPGDAYNIAIELVNNGDNDAFFDDIRIHPFRSNMKSYVYDPATQRLTATLDENNFATLYEYDDEGILVRVKKETERGVFTIQETRNNLSKIK